TDIRLICTHQSRHIISLPFFFFTHPAPPELYTLSLHDALPISTPSTSRTTAIRCSAGIRAPRSAAPSYSRPPPISTAVRSWRCSDRKSTRLNSSHLGISYAVFCLKKKKKHYQQRCIRRQRR